MPPDAKELERAPVRAEHKALPPWLSGYKRKKTKVSKVKQQEEEEKKTNDLPSMQKGEQQQEKVEREKEEEEEEEEEECSVCFELLHTLDRPIRRLNCCHAFHHECIQKWLLRDPRCPFCKANALPAAELATLSAELRPTAWTECDVLAVINDSGGAHAEVSIEIVSCAGSSGSSSSSIVDCRFRLTVNVVELIPESRLHLLRGHRYGLVGRNGVGKSLLLSQLAHGSLPHSHGSRVALVAQEELPGAETVLERVLSGDDRRERLLKELESFTAVLDPGPEMADKVAAVTEELNEIGGFDAEERATELMRGMGFGEADIQRKVRELSGGWRMRLSLARALFAKPDLLLLDEVTNHLDLEAIFWLQDWLTTSEATVVVVSHDAHFLDTVVTDVLYIGPEGLHCERGNYSTFEEHTEQHRVHQEHLVEKHRVQEDRMLKTIAESQRKACVEGNEKAGKAARMRSEKKLQRIGLHRDDGKRYKLFAMKKMDERWARQPERVEALQNDSRLRFKFPVVDPSPSVEEELISLRGANFRYGRTLPGEGNPNAVLQNVTLTVHGGTRAAIVGKNGAGKSTLLKILSGDLEPAALRSIHRGHHAVVATVSQHHLEALEDFLELSPAGYLQLRKGDLLRNEREARTYLGRFGLPGRLALTQLGELSGGLRTRVVLAEALLLRAPPTLLILDEPTNHLDFESIEALALGLELFKGAVVVVSHNVSFLSTVCKELWILQSGQIEVLRETEGGDGFPEHFQRYATGCRRDSDLYQRRGGVRRAVAVRGGPERSTAAY